MDFLNGCIGYGFLWWATSIHRPNDKIELFSKHWWIQMVLMMIGVYILSETGKLKF